MKKPSHEEVKELIKEIILPFYAIDRDMLIPNHPEGQRRNENDAEHSWSVAMLACSLAPHIDPKLDIGLISQFAVIHDLVEIYANDVSTWASEQELNLKETNEAAALEKIITRFRHFPWIVDTLERYELQDTNEALYVRAVDKYIAVCIRLMDEGEFFKAKGITKKIFDQKLAVHREKAHKHAGVADYYEKVRAEFDAHPEYFYAS